MDLEEILDFLHGLRIEHVVARGTAEQEDELKVGFLVGPAPLKVGLGIGWTWRGHTAIDNVP